MIMAFYLFVVTDNITSRLVKADGPYSSYSSSQGPSSRRALIPKSQESPRLFLKFSRETGDEVSDKQKDVSSYSVMLGMSEKGAFSPADSNVSSVDSDLYDPQLEQGNKPIGESDISTSNLLSKSNESSSVINSNMEFQNFEKFDNLEPDSQGMDSTKGVFSSEMPKQDSSLKEKPCDSEVTHSDKSQREYIPGNSWTNDDKFHIQNSSNHRSVSSSITNSVTSTTVNSVTSISSERTCTSNNFPNLSRNMSSSVVSYNVGLNSGDSDSLVTTSGLKWDLRSTSSPRVEDDGNLSSKSDSERVASPGKLDRDPRNSPRSDKEKDSRSCSPKVPPLKIILPQKSSSSSSSDSESLKIHVSKAALPYVVNKGEANPAVTAAANPVSSLLAQETARPSSPGSSRPSSRGSVSASTKDSDKKLTEDNKTSDLSAKASGELSEQDKELGKSKDEDKKEGASQKSTRTLRSHTKEQQKLQEKPKEKESLKEKELKEREKEKQGNAALILFG